MAQGCGKVKEAARRMEPCGVRSARGIGARLTVLDLPHIESSETIWPTAPARVAGC